MTKNWTEATEPSLSEAVAVKEVALPSTATALVAGAVMFTVGGTFTTKGTAAEVFWGAVTPAAGEVIAFD